MANQRVGLIGLSDMSAPIAKRVIGGEYELTVCGRRRRQPVEEIKALGAEAVGTPDEVAASAEITIVMLPDDIAWESVKSMNTDPPIPLTTFWGPKISTMPSRSVMNMPSRVL